MNQVPPLPFMVAGGLLIAGQHSKHLLDRAQESCCRSQPVFSARGCFSSKYSAEFPVVFALTGGYRFVVD